MMPLPRVNHVADVARLSMVGLLMVATKLSRVPIRKSGDETLREFRYKKKHPNESGCLHVFI